ncbi:DEAD/DEAH box helicase [Halosquirtibacter xylanolyticus]|uniref:DEAD/DEAH box helicase n=1 Tax=Halosquirtibacter xylanolyticus TaxID=3374599 RepID=UPI003747E71E|nr:DEAD/DEAH box helicase [Prolixibacteraceae bacterium]
MASIDKTNSIYSKELYIITFHLMELMKESNLFFFTRVLWNLNLQKEGEKRYSLLQVEKYISELTSNNLLTLKKGDTLVFTTFDWQKKYGKKIFSDQKLGSILIKKLEDDTSISYINKISSLLKLCDVDTVANFFAQELLYNISEKTGIKTTIEDNEKRSAIRKVISHSDIYQNTEFIRALYSTISAQQNKISRSLHETLLSISIDNIQHEILFKIVENYPSLTNLKNQLLDFTIGEKILIGNKQEIEGIKSKYPSSFNDYKLPWFDDLNSLETIPIDTINLWTNIHMNQKSKKLFVPGYRGIFIALILVKNNDDKSIKSLLTLANDGIKYYKDSSLELTNDYIISYKLLKLYVHEYQGKEADGDLKWKRLIHGQDEFISLPTIIGLWVAKWLGKEKFFESIYLKHRVEFIKYISYSFTQRIVFELEESSTNKISKLVKLPSINFKDRKHFYSYNFVPKKETWSKALTLIRTLKKEEEKHNQSCIMWTIDTDDYDEDMILSAYERSFNKNGLTKGHYIPTPLLHTSPPSSATPLDIQIARLYENCDFNDDHVWIASILYELKKHPHVYTDNNYKNRVEILERPFIVEIEKKEEEYHIRANQRVKKPYSYKETIDTQFTVTKATGTEIRFSKILTECDDLITIPFEQWPQFQESLKGLSTKLFIDGDPSDSTITIQESIAQPIIQMKPLGEQLKAEFRIKHHEAQQYNSKLNDKTQEMIIEGETRSFLVRTDKQKESKLKKEIINTFKSSNFQLDKDELLIISNDPIDSLELLSFIKDQFNRWTILWPEGETFKLANPITEKDLNMQIVTTNGWFEFNANWQTNNDNVMSLVELLKRSNNGHNRYIQLDDQSYISVSESLQKKIQQIASFGEIPLQEDQPIRIHPMLMELFDDWFQNDQIEIPSQWQKRREQIQKVDKKKFTVSKDYKAELRDYQDEGYQWMCKLYELGLGACLADDMGLGKTIQILALLDKYKTNGPSVVVAPSAVTINWEKEIARFAPSLNCKLLPLKNRAEFVKTLTKGDVLIVSYGVLQSNTTLLEENKWNVVALDEAHAIKNNQTSRSKSVMNLEARFKIAATGTPVQNHLGELWNLFQFLIPGLLGNYKSFQLKYITGEHASQNKELLKQLFKPFLLRRTKEEVLTELPEKTEIIREIELSKEEKEYYEASRIVAQQNIENADDGKARFQILSEITKLRQACLSSTLVDQNTKLDSSKLKAFEELIYTILDGDHKVLVFSQFTGYLKMIEAKIKELGYEYCYLDGSTTKAKRAKQIKTFQEGTPKIFLISLKAGGLGLNLTAADYVIHMDPWWNPAIEDQATDRAHRMGQEKPVTVYRLITKGTIEEKIIALHDTKRNLADQILEGTDTSSTLDLNELKSLLS